MNDAGDPFKDFSGARHYEGVKFREDSVVGLYSDFLERLPNQQPDNSNLRVFNQFLISKQQMGSRFCLQEDLAATMSVEIKDERIYQDGEVLNTDHTLWALNPKGILRIFSDSKKPFFFSKFGDIHHNSLFPKNNIETPENDIGLPVACAGHLTIVNGKITEMNRSSGYYRPTELQFILAIAYFNEQRIFDETVKFDRAEYNTMLNSLSEIMDVASMVEFL